MTDRIKEALERAKAYERWILLDEEQSPTREVPEGAHLAALAVIEAAIRTVQETEEGAGIGTLELCLDEWADAILGPPKP